MAARPLPGRWIAHAREAVARLAGLLGAGGQPLGWVLLGLVLRLPPGAQGRAAFYARLAPWFPHIDLQRLGWADMLRLPLQCLLLLLFQPRRPPRPASGRQPLAWLGRRTGAAFDRWWAMPRPPPAARWRRVLRTADRLVLHRAWQVRGLRLAAFAGGIAVAALAGSTPLESGSQGGLAALLLLAVWLLARGVGVAADMAARCLAWSLSIRYFWWRASVTLDASGQLALTLGLALLLAEGLLWLLALRGRTPRPWRGPSLAGFIPAVARLLPALAPTLAILGGIRLIDAATPSFLLYALPHWLAMALVAQGRPAAVAAPARALLGAWSLLRGRFQPVAPCALAALNLLALASGLLQWGAGAWSGMLPVFVAWALANVLWLGLAVDRADVPEAADADLTPSRALVLAIGAHRRLHRPLLAALGRTALGRFAAALWTLLPRRPVVPALSLLLLVCCTALLLPAPAHAQPDEAATVSQATRRLTLREMSGANSLPLRTTDGNALAYFGARADELVVRATLIVRYSHSPSLLPKESHIKVLLNGEVLGILPVVKDGAGQPLEARLEIDPRLFTDLNQLRFQFIGHYAATCEDPLRNSLWADISGSSELVTVYQSLALNNDLASLPEPFFDRRDLRELKLPFIFSASPGLGTVNAAGIVATWFGGLAGNRGIQFPAQENSVPPGHGVVVATNSDRPGFLLGHAPVDGPTVEVMTNPTDGYSKLLLILGRDGNDVAVAAQSLALGNAAMSGAAMSIKSRRDETPRQPYDAPKWLRPDRPTRLGELVDFPQQLQAQGHLPPPLKLEVKMPPDLFGIGGRGVPLDLRYRYSPSARGGESLLTVNMNDQLVQAFDLSPKSSDGSLAGRLGVGGDALVAEQKRLSIPNYKLSGRNRLNFSFAFSRYQEGPCPDIPPDDTRRAMIDPDSTLDISGFHHFARMPNLNHFATVGFPFTKYADLSHTVVVMPEHPTRQEIETAMVLLGHLGQSTGMPGSRVRIVGPGEEEPMQDADLLIIGSALGQGITKPWIDLLPASLNGEARRISQPSRAANVLYDWLGFGVVADPEIATQEKLGGSGPLAMLLSFQSPITPGYTVVTVTATAPDQLWQALAALGDPKEADRIHGSVSFIRGHKIASFLVGDTYFVGELPWWIMLWFPLSLHPLLLALTTIAGMLLVSMVAWRLRLVFRDDEDD